jgi:myo-inositol-1(or 4)-monophosphatase
MKLFISYPDRSRKIADEISQLCKNHGHETFVAYKDLAPDRQWLLVLCEKIDVSDKFVLCLTPHSLRAGFQKEEWLHARTIRKLAIVIYSGKWNHLYEQAFPMCGSFNRYRLEDENQRNLAIKSLGPPPNERLKFMQNLAIDAGTQLMARYGQRFNLGRPNPKDKRKNYSTEIDETLQSFITSRIQTHYPSDGIIAEESQVRNFSAESQSGFVWTVDPLDGTLNFVSGDDHFCCGIGLLYNGRPCLGAIFVPLKMQLYSGGDGYTAECRSLFDGSVARLQAEQSAASLASCHVLTHVNSEGPKIDGCFEDDFPKRLHYNVRRVWMWGCGLLALASVSRGSHHLFIQRYTYPWDVVPGLAILRAAGGVDSVWPAQMRQPWSFDPASKTQGVVAACNPKVLKTFFRKFRGVAGSCR